MGTTKTTISTRPAKPTNFEPQPPKTVRVVQAFLVFHQEVSGTFGELSCGVGLPGALFGAARAPGTSNFTENYPLYPFVVSSNNRILWTCHQYIVCEWVMLPNTHDCWVWKYFSKPNI